MEQEPGEPQNLIRRAIVRSASSPPQNRCGHDTIAYPYLATVSMNNNILTYYDCIRRKPQFLHIPLSGVPMHVEWVVWRMPTGVAFYTKASNNQQESCCCPSYYFFSFHAIFVCLLFLLPPPMWLIQHILYIYLIHSIVYCAPTKKDCVSIFILFETSINIYSYIMRYT